MNRKMRDFVPDPSEGATVFYSEHDTGIVYTVEVDDGFINVTEEEVRRGAGKDVFAAMSPNDALRMAKALVDAAEKARNHPRWRL